MSKKIRANKILVVDDHDLVLRGMIALLKTHYPDAEIKTARTAQTAWTVINTISLDLVILDLSIPDNSDSGSRSEVGISLLKDLMAQSPDINIAVISTEIKALIRVIHEIDHHQGGFTASNKALPEEEVLKRISNALDGCSHTKEIKAQHRGTHLKEPWLKVLKLAGEEGLQDQTISERLCVTVGTVRHYWKKIYDVLEIDPSDEKKDGKNLRILSQIRARELGLIE